MSLKALEDQNLEKIDLKPICNRLSNHRNRYITWLIRNPRMIALGMKAIVEQPEPGVPSTTDLLWILIGPEQLQGRLGML